MYRRPLHDRCSLLMYHFNIPCDPSLLVYMSVNPSEQWYHHMPRCSYQQVPCITAHWSSCVGYCHHTIRTVAAIHQPAPNQIPGSMPNFYPYVCMYMHRKYYAQRTTLAYISIIFLYNATNMRFPSNNIRRKQLDYASSLNRQVPLTKPWLLEKTRNSGWYSSTYRISWFEI